MTIPALILTRVAGADSQVLRECRFNATYFVGLGGAILSTSVISALGAFLALMTAYGDRPHPWFLIPFAVLWGLVILNLDRWLVSDPDVGFISHGSSGLQNAIAWPAHLVRETAKLLPRLLLSLVLGTLFAVPIELHFFDRDVAEALDTVYTARVDSFVEQEIARLRVQETKEQQTVQQYDGAVAAIRNAYAPQLAQFEAAISRDIARVRPLGCHTVCKQLEGRRSDLRKEEAAQIKAVPGEDQRNAAAKRLTGVRTQLGKSHETLAKEARANRSVPFPDGFVDRLRALTNLAVEPRRRGPVPGGAVVASTGTGTNATVRSFELLLLGALIGVDVAPVTFKWLVSLLPQMEYYRRVRALQEEARVGSELIIDRAIRRRDRTIRTREDMGKIADGLHLARYERFARQLNELRLSAGLAEMTRLFEEEPDQRPDRQQQMATDEQHPAPREPPRTTPPKASAGEPPLGPSARINVIRDSSFLDEE